jgi:hypothetical protein
MALFVALLLPVGAHAQQNIGSASEAHNQVSRETSDGSTSLNSGDPVFRDESVRTGAESTAKLIFLDSTNLAVGPISNVKLDRFVYDGSSQAMGVKLAKGLFRFTTGVLDKNAYSVTTPAAAIGVRGTVLDIAVSDQRTRVTLVEGRALVCPVKKGTAFEQQARDCMPGHAQHCDCVEIGKPGQTAQVSKTGGVNHASFTSASVQFASLCVGSLSLCSDASYASLGAASIDALCGR